MNSNEFNSIKIGDQFWMSDNLKVNCFQDGKIINEAKNKLEWEQAKLSMTPIWSFYNYDPKFSHLGKIYNGYCLKNDSNLAPHGWRIPTTKEWQMLFKYLNKVVVLNRRSLQNLKKGAAKNSSSLLRLNLEECLKNGVPKEWAGTNEYGFSASPNSFICDNGIFFDHGLSFTNNRLDLGISFWSSDWYESGHFWTPIIDDGGLGGNVFDDGSGGRYIRCVRD